MPDITRAIAALTYDEIEQHAHDWRGETVLVGEQVPLLHRSIANDLVMMAKQPELFSRARTNDRDNPSRLPPSQRQAQST